MHFARGKVTVGILDELWGQRGPELMADLADRARTALTRQFEARHSRSPSDTELIALVAEYTSSGTQLNESGAWTRARVEQIFDDLNGPDRVGRKMIVTGPAPGSEFLIADNPVATYRFKVDEAPVGTRHAWDAADEIVMPFAPDLAVCLVRVDVQRATAAVPVEEEVATVERTVELNARQIRGAQESVFYRLGTDFSAEITEALSR